MKLEQLVKAMPLDQRPRIAILTGSAKTKERRAVYASLADGSTGIVVGTHALITDALEFKKLGLAVIDEQHRFVIPPYELKCWQVCVASSQVWVPCTHYVSRALKINSLCLVVTVDQHRFAMPFDHYGTSTVLCSQSCHRCFGFNKLGLAVIDELGSFPTLI